MPKTENKGICIPDAGKMVLVKTKYKTSNCCHVLTEYVDHFYDNYSGAWICSKCGKPCVVEIIEEVPKGESERPTEDQLQSATWDEHDWEGADFEEELRWTLGVGGADMNFLDTSIIGMSPIERILKIHKAELEAARAVEREKVLGLLEVPVANAVRNAYRAKYESEDRIGPMAHVVTVGPDSPHCQAILLIKLVRWIN